MSALVCIRPDCCADRVRVAGWMGAAAIGLYAFDYRFDAAGNRTQLTKNGETTYYEYNTLNQLTLERSTAGALTYYQWQADGALERQQDARGTTYFTWDVDESLKGIATPAGSLRNAYDAEMKRVWREEDSAVTYFAFDDEKLVLSRPVQGAATHFVSEGPSVYDALVAHRLESDPATQAWYLPDALGTTLGLTGGAGLLTDTFLYEAFGNTLHSSGIGGDPYNYVGAYGYYQDTFALHLLWHRWYDAAAGRFGSRPQGGRQGVGAYRYVRGKPTRRIAPRGGRRDPCAGLKDTIDTLADQVQGQWDGSRFPPSCQALNDQLYRYLNCKYGFTAGPAKRYRP
ncbi:MAG: hypothetical protein ABFE07_03230, partial [Armatimonadia bacterium]